MHYALSNKGVTSPLPKCWHPGRSCKMTNMHYDVMHYEKVNCSTHFPCDSHPESMKGSYSTRWCTTSVRPCSQLIIARTARLFGSESSGEGSSPESNRGNCSYRFAASRAHTWWGPFRRRSHATWEESPRETSCLAFCPSTPTWNSSGRHILRRVR